MKTLFFPLLAGMVFSCAQMTARAQEYKEHVSKTFTLQKPSAGTTLLIYNISGPIRVEGYSGDKVVMDIDETITAENNQDLETGKKEVRLGFDQKDDSIVAYIAEPYDSRPHRHWHYHDEDRRIEYEVKLDYVVKVPFSINLHVSTVNDGDVSVKEVTGTLGVYNVNGSIEIADAKGQTNAHTVNGSVTVSYRDTPPDASSYYTVNGEMRITYPASLSADLQFKSLNGEFYTDFPNAEILPAKVVKSQEKHGGSTVYKLSKNMEVRIGTGGKLFKFETLNGNIYIKKQS
jgi:DUF4097 and DUF4098 domain-containing protein YvlB